MNDDKRSVRIPPELWAEIEELVRAAPGLWPSPSQFVRSAVFWFVRHKAGALLKEAEGEGK